MEFETIYHKYWQKVYRICLGYVNNESIAKDLAQEVFIKVWNNLSKFKGESKINTWIFRIASNQCIQHIQKEKRLPKTFFPSNISESKTDTKTKEERSKLLYQYISELSEIDRLIISLELEDLNQNEIAKVVGISPGNVRVRIHRIKEKLTAKFKKNGN